MRKIIFILTSLFSLAVAANEKLDGGFVVAPIHTDGYAAYGDCLATNEMVNDGICCITGRFVTIISAQAATDIKNTKATGDKALYDLQNNILKVYGSARVYATDGKQIGILKEDALIETNALPDVFIIKFTDGTAYKLLK